MESPHATEAEQPSVFEKLGIEPEVLDLILEASQVVSRPGTGMSSGELFAHRYGLVDMSGVPTSFPKLADLEFAARLEKASDEMPAEKLQPVRENRVGEILSWHRKKIHEHLKTEHPDVYDYKIFPLIVKGVEEDKLHLALNRGRAG